MNSARALRPTVNGQRSRRRDTVKGIREQPFHLRGLLEGRMGNVARVKGKDQGERSRKIIGSDSPDSSAPMQRLYTAAPGPSESGAAGPDPDRPTCGGQGRIQPDGQAEVVELLVLCVAHACSAGKLWTPSGERPDGFIELDDDLDSQGDTPAYGSYIRSLCSHEKTGRAWPLVRRGALMELAAIPVSDLPR